MKHAVGPGRYSEAHYSALQRQNAVTTFLDTLTYLCLPKVKLASMIWGNRQLPQEQIYNQFNISCMPLLHYADQL